MIMKTISTLFLLSFLTASAFADGTAKNRKPNSVTPPAVRAAAKKLLESDVKTVITAFENTGSTQCIPEGTNYKVEIIVRKKVFNRETKKVEQSWETAKHVNVSPDGEVTETCGE